MPFPVETIDPVAPGDVWDMFFNFAAQIPPSGVIASATITIPTGGHTLHGASDIGVYVPNPSGIGTWTPGASGSWIRQQFTAGMQLGQTFRLDFTAIVTPGEPVTRSVYAPVQWFT